MLTRSHLTLRYKAIIEPRLNQLRNQRSSLDLTTMLKQNLPIHMRTTLNIDQNLIERARELTGIQEKTGLVRESLTSLKVRKNARRLAILAARSLNCVPFHGGAPFDAAGQNLRRWGSASSTQMASK